MSKPSHKRLQKEYQNIAKTPPPFVLARPYESNLLECHFVLRGPPDSPYAGGEYHGVLLFTANYPFAPPAIKVFTPSGRFQPDRKLCTSFSDFHAGSWNPAWTIPTLLTGLLSFMLSDEITTGSARSTDAEKREFARASHAWNLKNPKYKSIFHEWAVPELKDLPNMGQTDLGKPQGPPLPANLGGDTPASDGISDRMAGVNLSASSSTAGHTSSRISTAASQAGPSSARRWILGLSVLVAAAVFLRVMGV